MQMVKNTIVCTNKSTNVAENFLLIFFSGMRKALRMMKNGISVPKVGDLPLGCAAVCSQSAWVQRLAVEAAVSGDAELLKQAALMDPLTGAVCNPPEVWQMVDEMLIAQEQWLPQYKEAITEAKERFAAGNLIPTNEGYRGAVRLREKTAEEVAAERREREERHKRE